MAKDYFSHAVNQVSTSLSSKKDIIEYYRDTYGENWKREAAIKMSGTSDSKSRAYQSAMRNFQGKRLTEAGSTAKWRELGKELPRTLKQDTIEITIKGKQRGEMRNGTRRPDRDRTIKIKLSGQAAQSWVDKPNWGTIWNAYGFDMGVHDEEDYDDYEDVAEIDPDYVLEGVSVSAA